MIVRLGSQLEHKSDGIRTSSQSLPLRQWPVDLDACALPLENRLGRACQCTGALVVDTLHAKLYVHSLVPPTTIHLHLHLRIYTVRSSTMHKPEKATDNDRRPTRMHPTKRGNFYVCICTCTYNFFFFLQNFVSGLKTYTGTPGLSSISLSISTSISSLPQTQTPLPYPRRQIRTYPHSAGAPCIWPASQSTRATGTLLSFSTSPFSFILPSPFSLLIYHYHHHHFSPLISAFSLPSPSIHTTPNPNPCLNRRVKSESRFPLSLA